MLLLLGVFFSSRPTDVMTRPQDEAALHRRPVDPGSSPGRSTVAFSLPPSKGDHR